jgi:hypothetical protein
MKIIEIRKIYRFKWAIKTGGRTGRSSLRILLGATNSEESGHFATRKLLEIRDLGVFVGVADSALEGSHLRPRLAVGVVDAGQAVDLEIEPERLLES